MGWCSAWLHVSYVSNKHIFLYLFCFYLAVIVFNSVNMYITYKLFHKKIPTMFVSTVSHIIVPWMPVIFMNIALILNYCNWHINYLKIGHMAAISDERAQNKDLGNIIKINKQTKIIKIVCFMTFICCLSPGIYLIITVL